MTADAYRSRQVGETNTAEREEWAGMKRVRIPAEDPDVVRARDRADLDRPDLSDDFTGELPDFDEYA